MDKQHSLSAMDIQKLFMAWHSKEHGWTYCLFVSAAWKFMASLKAAGIQADKLGEYLLVECPTKERALEICGRLPDAVVASIWHQGTVIHEKRRGQ